MRVPVSPDVVPHGLLGAAFLCRSKQREMKRKKERESERESERQREPAQERERWRERGREGDYRGLGGLVIRVLGRMGERAVFCRSA